MPNDVMPQYGWSPSTGYTFGQGAAPMMPSNPFPMPILDSNAQALMLSGGGGYQPPTRNIAWPGLNFGSAASLPIPGSPPTNNPALPTGSSQPGSIPFVPPGSMPSVGMQPGLPPAGLPFMPGGGLGVTGDFFGSGAILEPSFGVNNLPPQSIAAFDPSLPLDPWAGLDYGNSEGAFTGGIPPDAVAAPLQAPPSGLLGNLAQGIQAGGSNLWDALSTNMGNAYDPARAAVDPEYAAAWTTTGDAGGAGHQLAGLLNMGVIQGGQGSGYQNSGEGGSGFVNSTGLAGGGLIDRLGERAQRFRFNPVE